MDRRKTDRRNDLAGEAFVLDMGAVLQTLWRRKILVAFLTLLIFIPGAMYIFFKTDYYKATATLLLEDQSINLGDFHEALPAQKLDTADVDTQVKILTSPTLARETIEALEKKDDNVPQGNAEEVEAARFTALRRFLSALSVSSQGRTRVISVSYKSPDPYMAAEGANTHAQQYVAFQIRDKRQKVEAINEWMTSQIASLKLDSQKKAAAIQEFRKESGIVLGKNSEDLINQQILDLTSQLVPIETQKLSLQALAEAQKSSKGKAVSAQALESGVIGNLKMAVSSAKQELEALKAKYGTNHPDYIAAANRYRQASADLAREGSDINNSAAVQLAAITQQEAMIRDRLEELNAQGDELREKQVTLESLEAEELANRTLLESFLERSEQVRSQLARDRSDVTIESLAEIPTNPDGMAKSILFVLLTMFSIIAGIAATLLLELVDRGIEDEEDVKKALNLKLLGSLPRVSNPLSEVQSKKRNLYQENLKRLYLSLSLKKAPQSVLFTSATSGEGKTTTVVALARYLTSIRVRVLVIDADTINPAIADLTGVPHSPGFAEGMAGAADMAQIVHRNDDGIAVIPAGNLVAHPINLLGSNNFEKIITAAKTQYDFILIDASALDDSTDPEIMSAQVDGVILVGQWAKTPKAVLKKAAIAMRQYAKDVPGVILNKRT